MRRIIERVVTVVTTTTWKISWEGDSPDPVPASLTRPESSRSGPPDPTVIETKEDDSPAQESTAD